MITVKQLKEQLSNMPDDYEVFMRCAVNPCGNIIDVKAAAKTTYCSFGQLIDCVIVEPDV